MKNEIIAEIIADENKKFEKLLEKQSLLVKEFSKAIEVASTSNFEIKTDRLEEIINHWNETFQHQKKQINQLFSDQIIETKKENKKHRIFYYEFMGAIIIILILNKIKL
jgi:hypothetical protein